jgi:hypothetical protein
MYISWGTIVTSAKNVLEVLVAVKTQMDMKGMI